MLTSAFFVALLIGAVTAAPGKFLNTHQHFSLKKHLKSHFLKTECGGSFFVEDHHIINSEDYSGSTDCWWTVETADDRILYITSEHLNIQKGSDSIEIFNGPSKSSAILTVQTDDAPLATYSAENTVLIHFSKSPSSTAKFQLKFEKV